MSAPDEDVVARAHRRVGSVLRGKYHLDRVLGVGGMATVYAATHRNGKEFAVKVLHPELGLRKDIRSRFVREGYVANSVKHPGAVAVLDDDVEEDGTAFLVMELLHGQTVETLWQRCGDRLPLKLVTGVATQLLDVLASAHERGVIHRDIKPENLLVTREGQLKVLDFGIARVRDFAAGRATQTGFTMGTPAFMSPEHARAKPEEIDARTDLWAVGATIFTLASGRTVHDAEHPQRTLILAATTPARPLAEVLPDAPAALCRVVDRALAFDSADRWADAKTMRDALAAASTECFGETPTQATLAEQIREVGAGSMRPPGLESAEPRTLPVRVRAASGQALSPSLAGPTTAEPVATSPGIHTDRASPWASRRRLLTFGAACVGLGTLLVGALAARGRASDPASAQATAEPAAPPAAATPAPESSAALAGAPVPPATLRIDDLPAPSASAAPRAKPKPVAPAAPRAKRSCSPPYELDANGNKLWKRECL
jgi:eukaryotic-like serine/threonine-protein kinase